MKHKKLVISVKTEFAELIFAGKKTVEYRHSKPRPDIRGVYIHVCGEDPELVQGYAEYTGCTHGAPRAVFGTTKNQGGITEEEFFEYYADREEAFALRLAHAHRLKTRVTLASLGLTRPPQSFAYTR